jgi:hypothetical protein
MLITVRALSLINVQYKCDVIRNLLLYAVLQILNKIPDVAAQLLREDSDSSRTCLQMVVNMCYAMIIAFPRSDSMYDPVIRAMKVPYYRNFFSPPPHSLMHACMHTCVPVHMCLSVCQQVSPVKLLNSFWYWEFILQSMRQISFVSALRHPCSTWTQTELSLIQNCVLYKTWFITQNAGLLRTITFIRIIFCCDELEK